MEDVSYWFLSGKFHFTYCMEADLSAIWSCRLNAVSGFPSTALFQIDKTCCDSVKRNEPVAV